MKPTKMAIIVGSAVAVADFGCATPECVSPDYALPECRVVAENELARALTPGKIEVRFQDPEAADADGWEALGLVEVDPDGTVRARVAHPGAFAVSVTATEGPATARVVLDNVDPRARVVVGRSMEVASAEPTSTRRELELELGEGETQWIRGTTSCPERFRLAALGDIQTNPTQFERIVDALIVEHERSIEQGVPLMGLVIVGDLTEASRDDEFETIRAILQRLPIPVAVTAGNHDIYRSFRPHYNRYFGPGNYAFSICDARVSLVDTGSGHIAESVQARLPQLFDARGQRHLVIGLHHPPFASLTGSGWSRENQAQHLLVEAGFAGVDLVVAGHNHALRDFADIDVAGFELRQIISGTGGAYQGLGAPRYGYTRLEFDADGLAPCFVEVPAPGYDEPPNEPLSDRLPYCPAG